MTWKLDVILPYVDQRAALRTGDVVFTGTPEEYDLEVDVAATQAMRQRLTAAQAAEAA